LAKFSRTYNFFPVKFRRFFQKTQAYSLFQQLGTAIEYKNNKNGEGSPKGGFYGTFITHRRNGDESATVDD
jgi:hypothetical protein